MIIEAPPLQETYHKDRAYLLYLYGNAKAGILVTLFASSLLVFGFNTTEIQTQKYIWWLSMTVLMLIRMMDVYRWNKSDKEQISNAKRAVIRFVTGTLTSSIMWCVYCLYVLHYADNTELACMIIVVSALAGGAATVLAAHKFTAMSYALIMLGPFSFGMLQGFYFAKPIELNKVITYINQHSG